MCPRPVPSYPALGSSRKLWPAPARARSTGKRHDRQKTDSTGQTDNGGRPKIKNRAWSLPSYGGCFTGRCLPWLLGSTHHLGGLCRLQHKTPARDQTQSRRSRLGHTTGRQCAGGRATGMGLVGLKMCPTQSRSILQDRPTPAQETAREKMLADTGATGMSREWCTP